MESGPKHDNEVICLSSSSSENQDKDCGEELPSETLYNPDASMRMKCSAEASDFEANMPECYVLERNSHQRGTWKRKTKDDSSDSEIYRPRKRTRGQNRNALHSVNSITEQGMLNTDKFQFYFENIWRGISEEKRKSFAYLEPLWFIMYRDGRKEGVMNWIKKTDMLSKKICSCSNFIMESESSSPCMVMLDSLQSSNQNIEFEMKKYVLDICKIQDKEANRESIKHIPYLVPKVPQQSGEECGCYVLFYAYLFLENAPESFSFSDGYPYFMTEDWFSREGLDDFRNRLDSVAGKPSYL